MWKLNSQLIHKELAAWVTAKAGFLLPAWLKYPYSHLGQVNVLVILFNVQSDLPTMFYNSPTPFLDYVDDPKKNTALLTLIKILTAR